MSKERAIAHRFEECPAQDATGGRQIRTVVAHDERSGEQLGERDMLYTEGLRFVGRQERKAGGTVETSACVTV